MSHTQKIVAVEHSCILYLILTYLKFELPHFLQITCLENSNRYSGTLPVTFPSLPQ